MEEFRSSPKVSMLSREDALDVAVAMYQLLLKRPDWEADKIVVDMRRLRQMLARARNHFTAESLRAESEIRGLLGFENFCIDAVYENAPPREPFLVMDPDMD